jgi:hypothetical protein
MLSLFVSGGALLFFERPWAWVFSVTTLAGLILVIWDGYRNRKSPEAQIQTVFSSSEEHRISG